MILKIIFLLSTFIIYIFSQKNIISLAVLKTIILYPNLNDIKSVKKLHIIYSISILFSFILTPIFSNIILRYFFTKSNFKFNKFKNNSYKGGKLILSELVLDFLTAIFSYSILLFLIIYKSSIFNYLMIIMTISSIIISSSLSIIFKRVNNSYQFPYFIKENKFLSFFIIGILKIFRILGRDILLILAILNFKDNYIDLFEFNFDLIFKQAIMFNSSNYIQFLPGNLLVPEILCKQFNCLLLDYIWIRASLIISTALCSFYFIRLKKNFF